MDQRIKELAEQYACHTETMTGVETEYIFDFDDLLEFAELIRADERDKCAQDYLQDCADAAEEARRNERYIKEIEQPTPKQSGVMSITVSKFCEADALPPTANAVYWMEMVVSNLVRNGVNKHRAKELAYHFYTYTTPVENNNG